MIFIYLQIVGPEGRFSNGKSGFNTKIIGIKMFKKIMDQDNICQQSVSIHSIVEIVSLFFLSSMLVLQISIGIN